MILSVMAIKKVNQDKVVLPPFVADIIILFVVLIPVYSNGIFGICVCAYSHAERNYWGL